MTDEKQEAKAYKEGAKRERFAAKSRLEFVRAALQHREGREYFYWLLALTGLNANPFTNHALSTAFNCGQVNVGQQVRNMLIEAAPDLYMEMLKEQERDRTNPSGDRDSETGGDDNSAGDF